jgi:hypothetical protein
MGPARFHCATLLSMLGCVKHFTYIWFAAKVERHAHTMDRKKEFVSCEIRTHAHRSGLRPERSALDHSAKLTVVYRCRQPQATSYANTLFPPKVLSAANVCRPVSSVG